jgi:hypothetical protein
LREKKNFTQLFPPSEARLDAPMSINDPSRVSKPVRSATLQSLEEAGFVPPRSTVQILPRGITYDPTIRPDRHGGSQEMTVPSSALNYTIPSVQVRTAYRAYTAPQVRLPNPGERIQTNAPTQDPVPEHQLNPTSMRSSIPSFVVPLEGESPNSPTRYIGHPIGGGDTVLLDLVDGILVQRAQDGNAETEIRVHSSTEVLSDSITTSIVQSPAVPPTTAQTAATLRAPGFGRPTQYGILESIEENAEV